MVTKENVIEEIWKEFDENETKSMKEVFERIQKRIEAMPIDYNVEKVIEELNAGVPLYGSKIRMIVKNGGVNV